MDKRHLKSAIAELSVSGNSLREKVQTKAPLDDLAYNLLLQDHFNVLAEDITSYVIAKDVIDLIPYKAATEYCVLPLKKEGNSLFVAMIDPTDMEVIEDLVYITQCSVKPVLSSRTIITKVIDSSYPQKSRTMAGVDYALKEDNAFGRNGAGPVSLKTAEKSPVISLINQIISNAIAQQASDIHFEPAESVLKVRYRIDGVLQEVTEISGYKKAEALSRLKIMASLDIAEKRRPQDGRISIMGQGRTIDIRVSTFPTTFGEKVVLRILDRYGQKLNLNDLGFDTEKLEAFKRAIRLPYGMILVTGPTGSGKSSTLYAGLNHIKSPEINISTIEDPIEYKIDGINQAQVKNDINFTFANALRTLLRQDPNVIMVGEIRDKDTADIAIRSALTGHLVLSTLHTNDAVSSITRLQDMGVESFLISSALNLVVAQRLVRKICTNCKTETTISQNELAELGLAGQNPVFYQGKGCSRCNNTGYKGRIALFEALRIDDEIKTLITEKAGANELRKRAIEKGMSTLRMDGIAKLKGGITTISEVIRETTLG